MPNTSNIPDQIAAVLLETGRPDCVEKAETLPRTLTQSSSLHLRSLKLTPTEITQIANCFKSTDRETNPIRSISLSYNHSMGDLGTIALVENLPQSVVEMGLVGCGIGDEGGKALLNWMTQSPNLKMVCIENNDFSADMIKQFHELSAQKPYMMLVV